MEVGIAKLDFLWDNFTAMQIVNSKLKYFNMIILGVFSVFDFSIIWVLYRIEVW